MVKPTHQTTATVGRTSIWSRKRDLFYVVFLGLSMFLAVALDFIPLFPPTLLDNLPSWTTWLHDYYNTNYSDPLFVLNPPYFQMITWLELFVLVPLEVVGIWGLIAENKLTPLYILIWAMQYSVTSLICVVEVVFAKDWPRQDMLDCVGGYVLFGLIGIWILGDMILRVRNGLLGAGGKEVVVKGKSRKNA